MALGCLVPRLDDDGGEGCCGFVYAGRRGRVSICVTQIRLFFAVGRAFGREGRKGEAKKERKGRREGREEARGALISSPPTSLSPSFLLHAHASPPPHTSQGRIARHGPRTGDASSTELGEGGGPMMSEFTWEWSLCLRRNACCYHSLSHSTRHHGPAHKCF